jgi:hypothetical protein
MKVKVIKIRAEQRSDYPYPEPEAVENVLHDWLNDNPNASIEHVALTPVEHVAEAPYYGSRQVSVRTLIVTIFYRD